jgi:hypothetical protein
MDTLTCSQCGRKYENKNLLKQFRVVKLGKDFCSNGCEKAYERDNAKETKHSSSTSYSTGANAHAIKPSADEIRAEAEIERMERDENALQPWKFDSNFYNSNSISKISYPDTAIDIEKTILRITKTAVDKIKNVIETSYAEYQQKITDNQKAMWNPFFEEINLVDTCIEKANEGIKKLRRFEGNTINAMITDCQDNLDELKNKWYVKLIEKRDKKKKQNKIMIIVLFVILAVIVIGLAIAS